LVNAILRWQLANLRLQNSWDFSQRIHSILRGIEFRLLFTGLKQMYVHCNVAQGTGTRAHDTQRTTLAWAAADPGLGSVAENAKVLDHTKTAAKGCSTLQRFQHPMRSGND